MYKKSIYTIVAIFGIGVLIFSACKKESSNKITQTSNQEIYWTQEDVEIQNQILEFQNKVKNNNYKSGEQMTLEDAIWNLEALLNYNYSNPDSSFVNLTVDTTFEFNMPVNNGMVNFESIVEAALAMEAHMIDYLNNMPNSIKFIIAADVSVKPDELKDGTKTITITTGYGSEYIDNPAAYTPFGEDDYWLYGMSFTGGCETNTSTSSDAAEQIEYKINNPNYQFNDPYPAGSYVVNVGMVDVFAWDYPNPDDDVYNDNCLDCLMYGEYDDNDLLIADLCLEPTEMNFFLQGTLDVIQMVIDEKQLQYPDENIEFVYLSLIGDMASNGLVWDYYYHRGEITYGKRVIKVVPTE